MVELGRELLAVEAKSGQTIADDFFAGLRTFAALNATARPRRRTRGVLVYGGDAAQDRSDATVVPWAALDRQTWWDADPRSVAPTP